MESPSRPIIHRLRYETASSHESPTRIDGSSPISRCLPTLSTTGSSPTSHGGCKNDLTLNSLAARNRSTVVATRFSITNIALETCRFLRAITTAPLIHRWEPKSSCNTLDCCRLAKSTGSFLLSLTLRHQEMQKKLSV